MKTYFIKSIVLFLLTISSQLLASRFTMPPSEWLSTLPSPSNSSEQIPTQDATEISNHQVAEILQLSIKSTKSNYKIGEYLSLEIQSNQDCYLTVIDIGASGNGVILFPNAYQKGNLLKARKRLQIPNQYFDIQVGQPIGRESIWAICRIDNKPVTPQTYEFNKDIFISLGKITSITQLDNLPEHFSASKEARQEQVINIHQ